METVTETEPIVTPAEPMPVPTATPAAEPVPTPASAPAGAAPAAPTLQAPPVPAAPESRPVNPRDELNRLAERARKSGSFKDCLLFQRARRAVVG